MANEFPCAFRNAARNRTEQRFVERSRDDNTQRAVGSREPFAVDCFAELAGEAAQDPDLGVACPEARARQKVAGPQGQTRSRRIAYRANSASRRRAQERTQDIGE